MKQYELLYIIPATLTEEEANTAATKISQTLKDNGAEMIQEMDLGKKRLAYPIDHQHYGYYRLAEFKVDPERLQKINEILRLASEVVRHQAIVKPVKSAATLEREQALRARLAARRTQRTIEGQQAMPAPEAAPLTPEELEKKLDKILEETPEA